MALEQSEIQQIQQIVRDLTQQPVPNPAPVPVPVPVQPGLDLSALLSALPHRATTNTTTDIATYVMLALIGVANSAIGIFNLNKAQTSPTPAVVAPVQDPVQTKLVSDVADLQARVKVLEAPPVKK
jgi:drug/metabolite transporter (DMT)-like permease